MKIKQPLHKRIIAALKGFTTKKKSKARIIPLRR
jgi:hypothetical protein